MKVLDAPAGSAYGRAMIHLALALSILAAGQPEPVTAAPSIAARAAVLGPFAFFEGRSRSDGVLRVMFRSLRIIRVESEGMLAADGALTLTQHIDEQGKPPRTRVFRLRQVVPGRYAGTLTDADGPVDGEARGNRLRLRYRMAGGYRVDQRLTFSADGRAARSRINIYRMGMLVGTLGETIGRVETVAVAGARTEGLPAVRDRPAR